MMKHNGKIISEIIRNCGYSFTYLSKRLGINRSSLYNRLKEPEVSADFLIQIGRVIHYDFTIDFPEIKEYLKKTNRSYQEKEKEQLVVNEKKYTNLLIQYNSLLDFMKVLANEHNLEELKENIREFIKARSV